MSPSSSSPTPTSVVTNWSPGLNTPSTEPVCSSSVKGKFQYAIVRLYPWKMCIAKLTRNGHFSQKTGTSSLLFARSVLTTTRLNSGPASSALLAVQPSTATLLLPCPAHSRLREPRATSPPSKSNIISIEGHVLWREMKQFLSAACYFQPL